MTVSTVALGAGLIAVGGKFFAEPIAPKSIVQKEVMPEIKVSAPEKVVTAIPTAEASASGAVETGVMHVKTLSAEDIDLPKGSTAQKASLDDYRMLIKIDKKKTKEEKQAAKKKASAVTAEPKNGEQPALTVKNSEQSASLKKDEAYDKVYENCSTEIYDPKPDPLELTATRSVRDEYFTVNDIISGGTVTMNAHEMLCQMVNNEIGGEWDENAIKAQLVAAYSFLRYNDSIGFTPEVGLKPGYPEKIERCLSAVEGQAVFYDDQIINAVYSASSAGFSVESERIWDVYYPYLRAVVSEYDNEDPNYGLEYTFSYDEIKSIFASNFGISLSDNVDSWFVMEDIYSGRYVGYVTIDGQIRVPAREFEDALGLKSQAFTVSVDGGKVVVHTFGWGHGVGMSQWGACYYAEHGYTYDQILRHYYLNTTVALSKESSKAVARGAGN